MNAVTRETQSFSDRRITIVTQAPFETVTDRLEAAFPAFQLGEVEALIRQGNAKALRVYLERKAPGASFMVFLKLDQGPAMTLLGSPLQCRFYLIGNALLAQTMFALEPAAGLGAPVRLVVTRAADGTTHIDYDEPSAFFSQFSSLRDSPTPPLLDEKLRAALTDIAG